MTSRGSGLSESETISAGDRNAALDDAGEGEPMVHVLLLAVLSAIPHVDPQRPDPFAAVSRRWADVRDFGAKGDGLADDAAPFAAALKSPAPIVLVPPGSYRLNAALVVPTAKEIRGAGTESTKLLFYRDAATALEVAGSVSGLQLISKGSGQSGFTLIGSHPMLEHVWITDFQEVGLRLGNVGRVGTYFADVSSVTVLNRARQGRTGILVDGGGSPASNANTFRNVFVKGKWTTLVNLKGHNNSWIAGDTEWDPTGDGVDDVWLIEGSGNVIQAPYLEGPKGAPKCIFRFTGTANGNTVRDLYGEFVVENYASKMVDLGAANEISALPRLKYLPFAAGPATPVNLITNSYFREWRDGMPSGWTASPNSLGRTSETRGGASYGLKLTANNNNPLAAYAIRELASGDHVGIERLRGKTVTAGVWVRSFKKGMGLLRIVVDGTLAGTFGRDSHTGDGTWQFLTAFAKVPPDASTVVFQLRALESGAGVGEVLFSDPILVEGAHLPQPAPALLTDSNAKLAGPLVLAGPMTLEPRVTAPSVSDGNVFTTRNSERTTLLTLRDAQAGQAVTVIFGDPNTTVDFKSGALRGNGGAPWQAAQGDHMNCVFDGKAWFCSVSENSPRTSVGGG